MAKTMWRVHPQSSTAHVKEGQISGEDSSSILRSQCLSCTFPLAGGQLRCDLSHPQLLHCITSGLFPWLSNLGPSALDLCDVLPPGGSDLVLRGLVNRRPRAAARVASVDLLLWENLTWLDPEEISNPLSHTESAGVDMYPDRVHWSQSETVGLTATLKFIRWSIIEAETVSGLLFDFTSHICVSATCKLFSKSTPVLHQDVSCRFKHSDRREASFNVYNDKKKRVSISTHNIERRNKKVPPVHKMPSNCSPSRETLYSPLRFFYFTIKPHRAEVKDRRWCVAASRTKVHRRDFLELKNLLNMILFVWRWVLYYRANNNNTIQEGFYRNDFFLLLFFFFPTGVQSLLVWQCFDAGQRLLQKTGGQEVAQYGQPELHEEVH